MIIVVKEYSHNRQKLFGDDMLLLSDRYNLDEIQPFRGLVHIPERVVYQKSLVDLSVLFSIFIPVRAGYLWSSRVFFYDVVSLFLPRCPDGEESPMLKVLLQRHEQGDFQDPVISHAVYIHVSNDHSMSSFRFVKTSDARESGELPLFPETKTILSEHCND